MWILRIDSGSSFRFFHAAPLSLPQRNPRRRDRRHHLQGDGVALGIFSPPVTPRIPPTSSAPEDRQEASAAFHPEIARASQAADAARVANRARESVVPP